MSRPARLLAHHKRQPVESDAGGRWHRWTHFRLSGEFRIPVGYTFDTTATHTNALTFKFDGTNWNLISNSGGGGGASPLGNNGDLQSKNGAAWRPAVRTTTEQL